MRRAELREHEEKRCRGHDFRDDDLLADALRAWGEHGENRYADMLMFVLEPSLPGGVEYEERTR